MQECTAVKPIQERATPFAVEMGNICKAWPGVDANESGNLALRNGEFNALVC